jgi:hypothetical protein
VTVGGEEANRAFVDALTAFLGAQRSLDHACVAVDRHDLPRQPIGPGAAGDRGADQAQPDEIAPSWMR